MRRAERWTMPLGLLLASGTFNLAYTMLVPLVQVLKTQFAMEPWEIGLAFGGFALSKALFQPVGGVMVDRLRPLHTVLGGLAAVVISLVGLANATSGLGIILWRLVWGASEGIVMPGFYRLVSAIGKQTGLGEATLMGWFGSAAVSGMATGALLTGIVYEYVGYQSAFLIGALFALLSAATLWITLRHENLAQALSFSTDSQAKSAAGASNARLGLVLQFVVVMGLLDALNNGWYGAIEPILPLRVAAIDQDPVWTTSILFFMSLVVFAIASGCLGRLFQHSSPYTPIVIAFLASALTLYGMGSAPNIALVGASLVVFSVAQPSVYIATRQALATLPEGLQGRAFGLFGFLSDLGFILGPLAATLLWTGLSQATFTILALASFAVAVASYLFFASRFAPRQVAGV